MLKFRVAPLMLTLVSFASAQTSVKLIPIPREIRASGELALAHGVRIICGTPCSVEDQFAADDLSSALLARNIPVTEAGGFRLN